MDRREAILSLTTVLGYTVTPASIISLSSSCTSPGDNLSWDPRFFDPEGASIAEKLGEAILPKTDTPGARDVGAHIFADSFLESVASEADREKCRQGLAAWKSDYEQRTGKSLAKASVEDMQQELSVLFDLSPEQQSQVKKLIAGMPPSDPEEASRYHTYSFLMTYKGLIMLGYYASEQIGENVLSYLPVPGRYDSCIPVDEVGNAWAL
jgi:hypothetical protein